MSDWYEEMERAEQEYDAKLNDEARAYEDGYQQGYADKEAEIKPLLKAIKFALEDYAIRLGDYAKVINL